MASIAFVLLLATWVLLPRGVEGVRALVQPPAPARVEITPLLARVIVSRAAVAQAEQALGILRDSTARASALPADTAPVPGIDVARRDTLARLVASLGTLLQRAAIAPLASSYRALAESPALTGDPRVRALADSLVDVEREREDLGGGVTVDPLYVALTTQANALGRSIRAIGEERLGRLRRELAAAAAPVPRAVVDSIAADSAVTEALPDTLQAASALSAARADLRSAERALDVARLTNIARDSVAASERERGRLAPFGWLVAAAAVVALFLAFAMALADEMRSPRVADPAEAERLSGLRVLTVARVRPVPAERARRAADRAIGAALDPTADQYRILAWHLTAHWPQDGVVTVIGDEPRVAAVVGANLAAVLAVDARATLLVDTAFASEPVRGVLELPRAPGLAAVVENRKQWSESLLSVPVGRSRTMDVLPSGTRDRPLGPAETEALVADLRRAARRYDATVVVTPGAVAPRLRAGDDVVVCVVQGTTRLATLARAVATLIDGGARVRGVVLWAGRLPSGPRAA